MTEPAIKLADLPKAAPFELHPDDRIAIEHEIAHYDHPRAAVIEALKIVQTRHGWVPDAAIPAIAGVLRIGSAEVEEVATFYNLIFRQPVGRHVIKLCDSMSCYLTGYDDVAAAVKRKLGIDFGQTTTDGRFTLLPICCLGACDKGPVMMIDDDTHGQLMPHALDDILEAYR
ncbi:MAG: NADH-quinone oxidoreductase subunit NuoE [Gammaproteobacteria bacterium]|nr:NADH-quinone oxidoreductase subunit NuoE [Gammaproteobacteria bacterium]